MLHTIHSNSWSGVACIAFHAVDVSDDPTHLAFYRFAGLVDNNLADVHQDRAFTLRLSNYFPRRANASPAPRCGEHKDFGTFTVLFQAGLCLSSLHLALAQKAESMTDP